MNTLTGILIDNRSNKYKIISKMPIKNFKINLGNERKWKLGIDPASHYTGIALMDEAARYILLLDCTRDDCLLPEDFYRDLEYLLVRLVSGQTILRTVNEKPFVKNGYARASEVLLKLRGRIEEWVKRIPELADGEFYQINVNAWKSRVINKSKGTNRYNAKGAIAEDLCDIFPLLKNYLDLGLPGDLDSFDALGVIVGFDQYAYTPDGYKKICGEKEKSHYSIVGYKWINEDDVTNNTVPESLGTAASLVHPQYLEYNVDYSLKDNIVMASTNNNAVVTILPKTELQQFQWKFGIDITDQSKILMMFVFRSGHYQKNVCEYLKKRFDPMVEVVGGE